MTDTPPAPALNKARAAARLDDPARRVHRAILTAFAHHGQAPTRAGLRGVAEAAGGDLAVALRALTAADLIVVNHLGEVGAAYPFSATPTPHRLTLAAGTTAYAMCAIDALGVSAMLGQPVTVTSAEPDTGARITIRMNGDRVAWDPATAVVYAAETDDRFATSAERTCGYINFFTTQAAAHTWAATHPDLAGTLLTQDHALAYGIAEFGTLLHHADHPSEG